MSTEDAIGVVRAHRWATLEEQRARLKADGVRTIIDLGTTPRDQLLGSIRDGAGTVFKLAYAFLLTDPNKGAKRALADYKAFACKIAKLSREYHKPGGAKAKVIVHGYVKDLETGLVANTSGTRRAMLAVVKEQLAKHGKGKRSADNGTRGRKALVLDELQFAKGEAIWRNPRYGSWVEAEKALQQHVHKRLTRWRANRLWKVRKIGRTAKR